MARGDPSADRRAQIANDARSPWSDELLSSLDTKDVSTTELLGGLVLDGIEAAEERLDAIVQRLVAIRRGGDIAATTVEGLVRIVQAWRQQRQLLGRDPVACDGPCGESSQDGGGA